MNQYVGLLELICASSPMPTAEILQDVSVLYAKLGRNMKAASLLFQREPHCFISHLFAAQLQFCSKSRLTEIMLARVNEAQSVFLCSTAQKCTVQGSGDQENNIPHILDHGYCSTLKGNQHIYIVLYIIFLDS